MTLVPGGDYALGDTGARVTVRPFYIDAVEVTVAAYGGCVERGACTPANADTPACNAPNPDRLRHPINCVDWQQARTYCETYGKRLPTEEEWEWVARGGDHAWPYPWGGEAPGKQVCWNGEGNDEGKGRRVSTCGVGDHLTKTDPWGVHDLAGNVWEWTSTKYDDARYVVRGGSWYTAEPERLRASYRYQRSPEERDFLLGFRCAK
jgi:formylglycine-generating enzyme required for sulfatase activity